MGPLGVLGQPILVLPELASRLQVVVSPPPPGHGSGTSTAANPANTEPPPPLGTPAVAEETGLGCIRMKNMDAKPGSTEAKFSSISGPDIYYDSKSQMCFFDCHSARDQVWRAAQGDNADPAQEVGGPGGQL